MAADGLLTLAGGIAGAIAGFFVGGPTGAAIGFSIGAGLAAGFEDKPGVETGRITDLRVTGASYGDNISRIYGTAPTPGVMVWTSGLIEEKSTKKEGGGLFSSGTEVTTYSYKMNVAYLLCEGEIEGVGRIWFNGHLLYDGSSDATALDKSGNGKHWGKIRIYKGTETQTPDPTIEKAEGEGNVPAMRGMAYIFIKGLRLKRFYNKAPNIKAEVVKDSTTNAPPNKVHDLTTTRANRNSGILEDGTFLSAGLTTPGGGDGDYEIDHTINRADLYGEILDTVTYEVRLSSSYTGGDSHLVQNNPRWFVHRVSGNAGGGKHCFLIREGVVLYHRTGASGTGVLGGDPHVMYGAGNYRVIECGSYSSPNYIVVAPVASNLYALIRYTSDLWGNPTFNYDLAKKFTDLYNPEVATGSVFYIYPNADNREEFYIFYTSAGSTHPYYLVLFDIDFNIKASWDKTTGVPVNNQVGGSNYLMGDDYCFIKRNNTSNAADLYEFDHTTTNSTWTLVGSVSVDNTGSWNGLVPLGNTLVMGKYEVLTREELIDKGGQSLQAVVEDLHTEAGYSASDYDHSGLTGTVQGFRIPGPASARDSIQQLQLTHYFDLVEVDYKSTGVMRGGSSVQTFTTDDLAAHMHDADVPDIIRRERSGEMELPRSVTMKYLNRAANYETGTQAATRQVTNANQESVVNLNVVINDDEAAQAAHVVLYNEHANIEQLKFSVTEKYSKLVPSDLVTVPDDVDSVLVRITEMSENLRGVIDIIGVPEYVDVYTQTLTGSPSSAAYATLVEQNGPALLGWFDIPILADAEDNLGVYVGVSGYLSTWTGHDLYKFLTATNDYSIVASFVDNARIGTAEGALGDWTSGVVDWTNTITIRLANSGNTLTSSTEAEVIADATINRAVLGRDTRYEVFQFITATSLGGGRYTLSGLLRARRGTNYATANHESGDLFGLLSVTDIDRVIYDVSDVADPVLHKLVGRDDEITDIYTRNLDFNGYARLPFAPARVEASLSGSDWVITWEPRTRYIVPISNGVSYSDDPEVESYTVDFLDGSDVVKGSYTVTVGTETRTYTAAEQTTDFGSTQSDIIVVVYQKGTTLASEGHGYKLTTSTDARAIVDPKA